MHGTVQIDKTKIG